VLVLDHLVHSFNDLRDPGYLHYGYLRIFDDVVRWKLRDKPAPRLLFLGGGGYTLPRYIEASCPTCVIDVVEIDPAVTSAASSSPPTSTPSAPCSAGGTSRWPANGRPRSPTRRPRSW